MISFNVDSRFVEDLKDDFLINEELDLYEFIIDPVEAFYLGLNIHKWIPELDKYQKHLYSKQIRHNKDDLEKYQKQLEFWINEFYKDKVDEIDQIELSEYIINNMFFDEETKDSDEIKLAFFLGEVIYKNSEKK